jgi:hypothetical protein
MEEEIAKLASEQVILINHIEHMQQEMRVRHKQLLETYEQLDLETRRELDSIKQAHDSDLADNQNQLKAFAQDHQHQFESLYANNDAHHGAFSRELNRQAKEEAERYASQEQNISELNGSISEILGLIKDNLNSKGLSTRLEAVIAANPTLIEKMENLESRMNNLESLKSRMDNLESSSDLTKKTSRAGAALGTVGTVLGGAGLMTGGRKRRRKSKKRRSTKRKY